MGNIQHALQLITEKLDDVDRAIDFCKEHNDKELWEDLIKYSLNKPGMVLFLSFYAIFNSQFCWETRPLLVLLQSVNTLTTDNYPI